MAAATQDDGAIRIPRQFGNYEVLERISQEGGTDLYRARQTNLGRLVAITALSPEAADKPAYRTRFERQFAAASKLRHPNIRAAIDAGEVAGHRYIVGEAGGATRLSDRLKEGEWFGRRRSLAIGLDIARALECLEEAQIVHRHVTPAEILLVEAGIAKLRGFSFSKEIKIGARETWFDADPYWALYTAPEVVSEGEPVDNRSDIYSLGCVIYHLLSGRPPFDGGTAIAVFDQHINAAPPAIDTLCEDLPRDVKTIVHRCLEKDRALRYERASDVVADLKAAQAGHPLPTPTPSLMSRLRRKGRRS